MHKAQNAHNALTLAHKLPPNQSKSRPHPSHSDVA